MNQVSNAAVHQRAALRPPRPAPQEAPLRSTKVLDQLRERIRLLHYSRRTEGAYVHWCWTFSRFQGVGHPLEVSGPEVEAFLGWPSSDRQVAPSTHQQALSTLLFFYTLYTCVLDVQLPGMTAIGRPRVQRCLPVVLSQDERAAVFRGLDGELLLFAQLLHGTGMRLTEGRQLRVKAIDFQRRAIIVRAGKGGKDRVLMLPGSLVPAWREQLARPRVLWTLDQAKARRRRRVAPRAGAKESIPGLAPRGPGSGSSRRPRCPPILAAASRAPHHRLAYGLERCCIASPHVSAGIALRQGREAPGLGQAQTACTNVCARAQPCSRP